MAEPNKFYGKYRGTVLTNVDPLQTGRLLVTVPDVHGIAPSSWAMPCFAFAGKQMGEWALPQIGAHVWVEFEQGNPDKPIWTGCFYGSAAEVPALALAAPPVGPGTSEIISVFWPCDWMTMFGVTGGAASASAGTSAALP